MVQLCVIWKIGKKCLCLFFFQSIRRTSCSINIFMDEMILLSDVDYILILSGLYLDQIPITSQPHFNQIFIVFPSKLGVFILQVFHGHPSSYIGLYSCIHIYCTPRYPFDIVQCGFIHALEQSKYRCLLCKNSTLQKYDTSSQLPDIK